MNIITDLSSSKCDNCVYDAILMIVNHYTKMTKYISISKILTAIQLVDVFFKEIVCHYETFKEIVSDKDFIFTSSYWSEICYQTKVKCDLASFSFTNRQTNWTLKSNLKHYLHCYFNEKQTTELIFYHLQNLHI
jgi:hypothetical protein